MSRRLVPVLTIVPLLLVAQGGRAQEDYPDSVRDWMLMGDNEGQREGDAVQYHTEGYTQCFNSHPDWCNDLTPGVKVRGGFHKSYLLSPASASWYSSGVPGCVPYVQALKGPDGRIAEFGCVVSGRMNLVWEVLSTASVRKFYQNVSGSWQTGITWGLESGEPWGGYVRTFSSRVENCVCSGGYPSGPTSTSSPKGGYHWYFFNITGGPGSIWWQSAIDGIRQLGLVPASQPDSEVLPAAWTSAFLQQVGRSGQWVYLLVKKDYLDLYCGNDSCANWVETYWYLASSPYFIYEGTIIFGPADFDLFSFGLVRWNVQSLSAGRFYREGVQDTLVVESGSGRTFARQMCR